MPLFDDTMDHKTIPGGGAYNYSAIRPENLGAADYTLVLIAVDASGSTKPFKSYLVKMLQACIEACKKNPRSDNVLIRVIVFNGYIHEIHGFKPLNSIDINSYSLNSGGITALYDAAYSGIGSILDYGKTLYYNDIDLNACCYFVTDGMNNVDGATTTMIRDKIQAAIQGEELSSLTTVLIQLRDPNNPDPVADAALKKFREEVGITEYRDLPDATPETLAKLGRFMSKSISIVSNSCASGQPVSLQSLTV